MRSASAALYLLLVISPFSAACGDESSPSREGDAVRDDASVLRDAGPDGSRDGSVDADAGTDGATQGECREGSTRNCEEPFNPCESQTCVGGRWDDGACSITHYSDVDGDGWGEEAIDFISPGFGECGVVQGGDCDFFDADIHPDATDVCDGVDNDCDGLIDEDEVRVCPFSCGAAASECETPTKLTAGSAHFCALLTSGRVACWGNNSSGQASADSPTDFEVVDPKVVPGVEEAIDVDAFEDRSCALTTEELVCWGGGFRRPVRVSPAISGVEISMGGFGTCVRTEAGAVTCHVWNPGQTAITSTEVVLSGAAQLAGSATHQCALMAGGAVTCWDESYSLTEIMAAGALEVGVGYNEVCVRSNSGVSCGLAELAGVPGMEGALGLALAENAQGVHCGHTASAVGCWEGDAPRSYTFDTLTQVVINEDRACGLEADGRVLCWHADDGTATPAPAGVLREGDSSLTLLASAAAEGACQSWSDITGLLGGGLRSITKALASCTDSCADVLDTAGCRLTCVDGIAREGVSTGCFACLDTFDQCSGDSCYSERNECIGFNPDFLRFTLRNGCDDVTCRGSDAGAPCENDAECRTNRCGSPGYLYPGPNVCLLPTATNCDAIGCGSCEDDRCSIRCDSDWDCPDYYECRGYQEEDLFWCVFV